jgi:hypothetical protein
MSRDDFTQRDDYVFCNRLAGRLDDSAVRQRYHGARKAAGLRYVKPTASATVQAASSPASLTRSSSSTSSATPAWPPPSGTCTRRLATKMSSG